MKLLQCGAEYSSNPLPSNSVTESFQGRYHFLRFWSRQGTETQVFSSCCLWSQETLTFLFLPPTKSYRTNYPGTHLGGIPSNPWRGGKGRWWKGGKKWGRGRENMKRIESLWGGQPRIQAYMSPHLFSRIREAFSEDVEDLLERQLGSWSLPVVGLYWC